MKRVLFITISAIAISGCASTAKWQHPARAAESYDGATMAEADCEAYAMGRSPMPTMMPYMPTPAASSDTTTGTYQQHGNYGSFTGTTRANSGFASGYAQGANMGANIANAYAVGESRRRKAKLTEACMRTLGWIDTSTPEGQAQYESVQANLAEAKAKPQINNQGAEKWATQVQTFVDTEAARPGGIDYRNDDESQALLDKFVKQLANDPKNDDKTGSWFLIEGHKQVLAHRAASGR